MSDYQPQPVQTQLDYAARLCVQHAIGLLSAASFWLALALALPPALAEIPADWFAASPTLKTAVRIICIVCSVVAKMRMNHPFARCNAAKP